MRYNELPAEKRGGPRFYVEDNIDPARMDALFDVIDIKKPALTSSQNPAAPARRWLSFDYSG